MNSLFRLTTDIDREIYMRKIFEDSDITWEDVNNCYKHHVYTTTECRHIVELFKGREKVNYPTCTMIGIGIPLVFFNFTDSSFDKTLLDFTFVFAFIFTLLYDFMKKHDREEELRTYISRAVDQKVLDKLEEI